LLTAVDPKRVTAVQEAWNAAGVHSWILGRFEAKLESNRLIRDGKETLLLEPEEDPFWELFFRGIQPQGVR
jgi:hypothetical protein